MQKPKQVSAACAVVIFSTDQMAWPLALWIATTVGPLTALKTRSQPSVSKRPGQLQSCFIAHLTPVGSRSEAAEVQPASWLTARCDPSPTVGLLTVHYC